MTGPGPAPAGERSGSAHVQSIDAAHEGAGSRAGAPHVSENGVSRAGGGAALCVALCGGIHLDRLAHADRRILPDTSTPGRILTRPGGVATNVAMVLARLAIPARLFGRIGRDGDGDTLSAVLARRGIDMSGVREGKGATASYLALHDPGGRLAAAVVDDAITFEFAPDDLPPAALAQAAIWFADANLRADTLERLAKLAGARGTGVLLVADAVSIAKARRLEPVLGRLDLLFANRAEAAALVGTPGTAETLARALVDMEDGPRAAIVTDGESGAALAQTGNKTCLHRTALPARVVDVTGAGDALTGGTLAGLAWGLDLAQALDYGRAAAALTVEATGAAPESLTLAALHLRLDAVEAD